MTAIAILIVRMLRDCFKPRPRLEAEILILRHQLNVLQRRTPRRRLHLRWIDRALFIWLYRRYPRILDALSIVRPETVVRWHRKGFTGYWRWKSRSPGGRPRIAREVRDLVRRMSFENSLWGATKIHGELLKLGIAVAQSTVSVYMVPRRGRPLQTWKTFLRNHMEGIASIDLFVATVDAVLFAGFIATMGESDFLPPCIEDFGLMAFSPRARLRCLADMQDIPVPRQGAYDHAGVSDRAEPAEGSHWRLRPYCLPPCSQRRRSEAYFRGANKTASTVAEPAEPRRGAKGNAVEQSTPSVRTV